MKRQNKIKVFFESIPAVLAFLIIPWIPRRILISLAKMLGKISFAISKRQRYVALANLLTILNRNGRNLTPDEAEKIAKHSFGMMILVVLDVFWFSVFTEKRIRKYIILDESAKQFAAEKGGIAVAAHFGNWEIMGQAGALYLDGLLSVAAELRNPFIDKIVSRTRKITGQQVVYQDGAVRKLMSAIKKNTVVALLIDQNVVPAEGGVFVDMFGLPVPVSRAVAALAAKANVQVGFIFCLPDKAGYYKIYVRKLAKDFVNHHSQDEITQAVIKLIETEISKHPEYWMWAYKRWKFIPENHTGEGFPTYARPIEPPEMKKTPLKK